jgi:hypothetical protein
MLKMQDVSGLIDLARNVPVAAAPPESGSSLCPDAACGTMGLRKRSQWRNLLRLPALALVGLAVAIVLWGLAYKLSLYQPHPTPSERASVAKVCTGPRSTASVSAVRVRAAAPPARDLVFLQSQPAPVLHFNRAVLRGAAPVKLPTGFRSSPGMPRSPPAPSL